MGGNVRGCLNDLWHGMKGGFSQPQLWRRESLLQLGASGVYLEAMRAAFLAQGEVLRLTHWQALEQRRRRRR